MRAVVQRVSEASVIVDGQTVGEIRQGLVVLLGVARGDTSRDAVYLAEKTSGLRIFEDEHGKMNRSVEDISGSVLVVSQFTLLGDCRKGRRPGFTDAAEPELADMLYEDYVGIMQQLLDGFRDRLAGQPGVTSIRGRGMMIGIELERPCAELVGRAIERGLLINVTAGRVVRLLPPLITTENQAKIIVDQVSELIIDFLAEPDA